VTTYQSTTRSCAPLIARSQRRCGATGAALLAVSVSLLLAGCGAAGGQSTGTAGQSESGGPGGSASATSQSSAPAFDPSGSSTPQAAALAFENALENQEPSTICQYITPQYLAELAHAVDAAAGAACMAVWTENFQNIGPPEVEPSTEHLSVVSTTGSGNTVYVRINFGIPPSAVAQLEDSTVPVKRIGKRWLVAAANT
jgi:hypothetical protein